MTNNNLTVTTGRKQVGKYVKGQSGNPTGRPKGALNKTTLAAKQLLDGQAEALTQRCIEMAMMGDMTAMRLCLERIMPPVKQTVELENSQPLIVKWMD